MKKSRINSVELNDRRPLKIEQNLGLMIIRLRKRVEKLMNMNEQPVRTRLSKNWAQLVESKAERTRFHLAKYLFKVKKNQSRNRKIYSLNLNNMLLLTR